MARPHNVTKLQREIHKNKVLTLKNQGYFGYEIAEMLGVTPQAISAVLRTIEKDYEKKNFELSKELFGTKILKRIDELRTLIKTTWLEFRESQKDAVKIIEKGMKVGKKIDNPPTSLLDLQKIEKTTTGQYGDPRFLFLIKETLKEISELEGLYSKNIPNESKKSFEEIVDETLKANQINNEV